MNSTWENNLAGIATITAKYGLYASGYTSGSWTRNVSNIQSKHWQLHVNSKYSYNSDLEKQHKTFYVQWTEQWWPRNTNLAFDYHQKMVRQFSPFSFITYNNELINLYPIVANKRIENIKGNWMCFHLYRSHWLMKTNKC